MIVAAALIRSGFQLIVDSFFLRDSRGQGLQGDGHTRTKTMRGTTFVSS